MEGRGGNGMRGKERGGEGMGGEERRGRGERRKRRGKRGEGGKEKRIRRELTFETEGLSQAERCGNILNLDEIRSES